MKVVYKYPLKVNEPTKVELPKKGTGLKIEGDLQLKYVGTDFSEGSFVWHCFLVL